MGEVKALLSKATWTVERTALLEEVILDNEAVRFRVQVSDEGRRPFISRWFNDPVPAADFIDKIKGGHFNAEDDR